jgi:outer membrane receptor protein involved in Fe transport
MKYTLFAILIFCNGILSGQNTANISGKVVDKSTNEILPFSSVFLTNKTDNSFASGTITDEKGIFILKDLKSGNYLITISFVGFQSYTKEILIGALNNNYDIGKIELEPSVSQLGEVQVAGERVTVSATLEKKSFTIDNNISQTGGSLLKAIQNLPGITVDTEGKIYLRGSDKVTVLIDNKQSSLTGYENQKGLDNIPASNIERIEIINNPSAKYDAKGMAGIVNIIYKKEQAYGFNGEIGLSAGVGEMTTRKENLPAIMDKYSFTPKLSPNLSINYRAKKVNIFLQTDGMVRKRVNTNEFSTRKYFDGVTPDIQSQFLENRSQQLYNIKAGADWYLNDNNTLTFYALWEDEYHIDRGDVPYYYLDNNQRYRLWQWAEDEDTKFINFSMQYNHKFEQPGHNIDIGYIYTGGGEDELFPFTDSSSVRQSSDQTHLFAKEFVHSINVDYTKPLKAGRIESGIKVNLRHLPITYIETMGENSILDPNVGSYSDYYEDVIAGYVNYTFESKLIEIEGGIRAEQSFIKYETDPANIYLNENDKYNYFNLFPNIRFTYKINDQNRLSAFINKRIDRPTEFDLRPFPKYDDPEILKTGNPFLRPQYTQTFELAYKHNWGTGSAYISLFHRQISDIFSRIYTADTLSQYNVVNAIPQNLGKGYNTGFEIFAEHEFAKWVKLSSSFNWYQNILNECNGINYYPYPQPFTFPETKSNTWNFKVNANFELKKEISIQMTGIYYAPDIVPQGVVEDRYSLDFGVSKKFSDEKWEIYLNANDIFNTFAIETTLSGDDLNLHKINYAETQTVIIGMKYKF